MPACLLLLIGLPGSGKTTLARRLCSTFSPSYRPIHVEYDAAVDLSEQARLQAAAAAGQGENGWRAARREIEQAVEATVAGGEIPESLCEAMRSFVGSESDASTERPTVFIIDDNMYLRSMRYRYFQLARRHHLGFVSVFLDVPVSECLRRNSTRRRPVPEEAVRAMADRLERPESGRLWEAGAVTLTDAQVLQGGSRESWRKMGEPERVRREPERELPESGRVSAEVENMRTELERALSVTKKTLEGETRLPAGSANSSLPSEDAVSVISHLVASALRSPVPPLVDNSLESAASRLTCSTSQLHQLDRQLRRLVGQLAAGGRASAANTARQRLMRRVRAGEVGLNVEPAQEERFAEAVRRLFEAELAVSEME